jgi:hypothetical protein
MRRQTWFAVIVCIVLMVPSLFIGAVVKIIYHAVVLYFTGPDPDPFHMHSWFGVDAVRAVWSWMYRDVMPNLLQGLFAGVLAFELTSYVCKGARIIKAGFITGLVYTALVTLSVVVFLPQAAFARDALLSVYQLIGVWCGLLREMAYAYGDEKAAP